MKINNILLFVASSCLIVSTAINGLLPDWVFYTLIGCSLLGYTFIFLKLKTLIKIILSLFMLISSSFLMYSRYSLEKIVNNEEVELTTLSFLTLKESKLVNLSETKGLTFGISGLTDEITANFLKDLLNKEIETYKWKTYEDDLGAIEALYSGEINVMILDDALRTTLEEQITDFADKTKVIYTIEKSYVKEVEIVKPKPTNSSFTLLISGLDTSGPITTRSRSDVNILMSINPVTHQVVTVSIPRDTYVNLGCKTGALDKLTHSGIYGIDCTVKTIENLMDVPIDYYVKVNFSSFTNIIKAIGKINVYSQFDFSAGYDSQTKLPYHFVKGMNLIDSDKALVFARERYAFASQNYQRGMNQQEIIKGILNKILQPSSLLKINSLIDSVSKSIDTNIPAKALQALIKAQLGNNAQYVVTSSVLTCKGDMQPTYSMGQRLLYVCWTNQTKLTEIQAQIKNILNAK